MNCKLRTLQHGFTLIECMIALTLGMLVIAAATALLLSAQQTYLAIDDSARIDDAGASALAALGAAIRQAAYVDYGGPKAAPTPPSNALFGIDNAWPAKNNDRFDLSPQTRPAAVNGSDMLVTRFMATDIFGKPDPGMLNCAGDMLKKPATPVNRETVYNWSIFYIKSGTSGETELYCKPFGKNGSFRPEAIVRGVETMQLLYGMDKNGDGLPDTFLQAAAIGAADWAKVTAVSIALSIRGASSSSPSSSTHRANDASQTGKANVRHLFGPAYSAQHADGDLGVSLDIARMNPGERNRSRRIVRGIVMLRNKPNAGEG